MADGTSVGKISLDIDITGDISKQISAISEKVGTVLKSSVENTTKGIFKDVEKSTNKSMKMVKNTITGQLRKIKSEASAVMKSFGSIFKKIKLPKDFGIPQDVEMPQTSATPTTQTRGPPKFNTGVDFERVKAQIDNLSRTLDTTNAQIQHRQNRLADLKKSYESAFNPDTKNKIQEEIFKTETKLNTLIGKSDQTGFKLADLDNKLQGASNTTSGFNKALEKTNATIKSTTNNLSRSAKATANVSKKTSGLGKVADNVGNRFSNMGRMISSAFKRVLIMATLYKAIRGFVSYMNGALATNKQFSNSLAQVKTNLQVAFMPIYQAILPAINALMSALAKVTTYAATFVSALFGKTYQQSFKAAQGLNNTKAAMEGVGKQAKKTAKEVRGALAGFDEINTLDMGKDDDAGDGIDIPQLVAPPIDTSPVDGAIQGLIDKVKELGKAIKDNFSEGFKIGLDGASLDGTKKHLEGIKKSIKGIFTDPKVSNAFKNWGTRQIKSLGTITGSFANIGISIAEFLTGSVDKYLEKNSPFIKEKIISIFDISGDIGEIKANFSMALANVFSVFKSDQAKEIGSDIVAIFANSFLSIVELGLMFVQDFLSMVTQPFIDNQEEIKLALENTMLFIGPIIEGIKLFFENAFASIKSAYEEYIAPAMKKFGDGFSEIFGALLDLYNKHLAPMLKKLGEKIKKLMDGPVGDMVKSFADLVGKIVSGVAEIWDKTLSPLISWLIKTFGPTFGKIFGTIGDVFIEVFGVIAEVLGGIFDALGGLIDFIVGIFTGDWKKAWGGIKDFFKGIWDSLVAIVKAPIDLIKRLITSAADGIGKITSSMGDALSRTWDNIKNKTSSVWSSIKSAITKPIETAKNTVKNIVDTILGFFKNIKLPEIKMPKIKMPHFDFSGKFSLSPPQVPKFKINWYDKGGIFNEPSVIGVGEKRPEFVGALDDLRAIIRDEFSKVNGNNSNDNDFEETGDIVLQIGDDELGRIAIKAIKKRQRKSGETLMLE